jgi:tripartite-type tricarboxylate transporter receptor subunit TctC
MRRRLLFLAVPTLLVIFAMVAFSQLAAAATKTEDFPAKDKSISIIVGAAAGGGNDIGARILAPALEAVLGVPVRVVNIPGAVQQAGINAMLRGKPDGYTIAYLSIPSCFTSYLDPQRKATATFGRKDLLQIANHVIDPEVIMVRADSPYKTLNELVVALKARPGQLAAGTSGLLGNTHLELILFQKAAGVDFKIVHFESGNPAAAALLGGHVDFLDLTAGTTASHYKNKTIRYLALADKTRSKLFPETPTMEEQGYKIYYGSARGLVAPVGTPKEIIRILAEATKRAMSTEQAEQKIAQLGLTHLYLGPEEYTGYWDEIEGLTKPILEELARENK